MILKKICFCDAGASFAFHGFFQCHVKRKKLIQLCMETFLKGSCNFSATFPFCPNLKNEKKDLESGEGGTEPLLPPCT